MQKIQRQVLVCPLYSPSYAYLYKQLFMRYKQSKRFLTEPRSKSITRTRTIEKSQTKARVNKILLPNLKTFNDFDYESDMIRSIDHRKPKDCETPRPSSKHFFHQQSNIPHQASIAEVLKSPARQIKIKKQAMAQNASPMIYKTPRIRQRKLYKYIENFLNDQYVKQRKSPTNQEDVTYTTQSFSPAYQKDLNIIFHNFKNKKIDNVQRQSSIISQPLFDIAKISQKLNEFMLLYQPLSPSFDIKEFVRDLQVQIISNENYIFAGTIKNSKMQGQGILITQKSHFQGEFQDNCKRQGIERNKNGVYQGSYQDGKRSGVGKFIWKNGQSYEGDWQNGKKNGHGIWKSLKGDYYEGDWKQNLQNGKGCYFHKGCSMYRGYFKDSLKHGRGEELLQNGDKYQGQYNQGKPHGYGKYTWANGDVYFGYFAHGSRLGKGTLKKITGEAYEGQFKEDSKHGFGKQMYNGGQYFQGQFDKGLKQSGSYFSKEGIILKTF